MLSERKKKILCAVVDGYIESATPISSKEIMQSALPNCSSATIRNELSALESMGYLIQPHVSAGRIPSQRAFRIYVDELMSYERLSDEETNLIVKYLTHQVDTVEEMVERVAKVLSEITHLPALVLKEDNLDIITSIKLLDLDNGKALVVIVTDCRVLKDSFVDLPEHFTSGMLKSAQDWLNKIFVGKRISDFLNYNFPFELVNDQFGDFNKFFKLIVDTLKRESLTHSMQLSTVGENKIFEHVEYKDSEKAKQFLDTVEQKELICELLYCDQDGTTVKIDKEDAVLEGCSLVKSNVQLGENISGSIGVIGPVRMNYKRVVAVVDKISKILNYVINSKR